tara:strand:- start:5059 stop:5169 length:111 start_codon:yes stop_codon:yes gene_type:complete
MILPVFSAFLAILIYSACAFAMYKHFSDKADSYMRK